MAIVTLHREAPVSTNDSQEQGNAMKLLFASLVGMVAVAGVVTAAEETVSSWAYFWMAGVGGSFGALSTYLLAGKKNDSHSLASHILGNVSVATFVGAITARHAIPYLFGREADVTVIAFCGWIAGVSGMAIIGAARGTLSVRMIQQTVAKLFGLEVPAEQVPKTKSAAE